MFLNVVPPIAKGDIEGLGQCCGNGPADFISIKVGPC